MGIRDALGLGKLEPWNAPGVSSKVTKTAAENGYPFGCFGNPGWKLRHERPRRVRMGKPQNWKEAHAAGITWAYNPKAKR